MRHRLGRGSVRVDIRVEARVLEGSTPVGECRVEVGKHRAGERRLGAQQRHEG